MSKNDSKVPHPNFSSHAGAMEGASYVRFEEKMRGPRSIVRDRLRVYLPIISSLHDGSDSPAKALDIGSGRGEWLELLKNAGFQARGVDSNPAMIEFCQGLSLEAIHSDAFHFLSRVEDRTLDLVTAFHVVEHLTFSELERFVRECLRVLRPAGILIMETPNPQNVLVGCSEFYVDPTHQRPLPPKLLRFATEDAGFLHSRILYLNGEKEHQTGAEIPQLRDVFIGTGFDYAVIAQKGGDPERLDGRDISRLKGAAWPEDVSLESKLALFDQRLQEIYDRALKFESFQQAFGQSAVWRVLSRLERRARSLTNLFQGK